jgi:hypothetical protein
MPSDQQADDHDHDAEDDQQFDPSFHMVKSPPESYCIPYYTIPE